MAWSMTICAALAGLALQAGGELPSARTRSLLSVVVTLALLVAALLCAGVSPSLLQPSRWDELASGIAEGIGAIPAIASPYRGGEAWIEVTVLLGGRCSPRSRRSRRSGRRATARCARRSPRR